MMYGRQTWALNKQLINKLQTTQRAMERKVLKVQLHDKISVTEKREKTEITDVISFTQKPEMEMGKAHCQINTQQIDQAMH